MTVPDWIKIGGAVVAITATSWAFADAYGFRPALKAEVDTVARNIETVAVSVDWLRLENYERRLARGQALTRRECADYRRLAERLRVPPKPC